MINLRKYYLIIFIFLLLVKSSSFSEDIKVLFKKNPKVFSTVKSFAKSKEIYISLNDFLSLLSIRYNISSDNKRISFLLLNSLIRFERNSPFLFVKNTKNNKISVTQCNARCLLDENEFYVPLDIFNQIINKYSNIEIDYNTKTNTFVISENINPPIKHLNEPNKIYVSKKINGYTIKIPLKSKISVTHKYIKQENLVVLRFLNGNLNLKYTEQPGQNDIIDKVIFKNYPSTSELKLYLNEEIESLDVFYSERNKELYILLFKKFNVDSMFNSERKRKSIENDIDKKRKKWELNTIIIDPGHGGKDPGCIGISKIKEKDIVLNIALKLGKLIEKKTNLKVYYTRKNDTFIPLYKRGQFANEKKGNLFISIHCNSNPTRNPNINGFEVYILRPGRTEEAIAVAELENSVIKYEEGYKERYKHLSDESFILTAMAQNAYVKFSETFAGIIGEHIEKDLSLKNKGVLQAGFYVLVGASMPSVLLETGYLTNKHDEAYLKSSSGQQKIAETLFKAIMAYKKHYEKYLLEGK
jgi:N-acetylmuramoyl-L-alanine amidase